MLWDSETWCWIVTGLLFFIGMVGSLLPLVPGCIVIIMGILCQVFWGGVSLPWWMWVYIAGLFVFSLGADKLTAMLGTKLMGSTKAGLIGTFVGAILGSLLMTPIVGLFIGAFVGAVLAEWWAVRRWRPAVRGGVGATVGVLVGLGVNFFIAVFLVNGYLAYYFWLR